MRTKHFTRIAVAVALCLVMALSVALLAACGEATITLNLNYEGASSTTVKTNSKGEFNLGADPQRAGYKFEGWYTDQACTSPFTATTVKDDVTLYAKWTELITLHVVTYNYNFTGSENKTVDVRDGATHVVETYTRPDYRLDGYVGDDGKDYAVGDEITVTADLTLTAKWTRVYTVTFDLNGGTADYQTVFYLERNQTVTMPEAPVNSYREFVNWTDQYGQPYDPGEKVKITANTTFTAQWSGNYAVIYDVNGGEFTDGDHPVTLYPTGATVTTAAEPTREGYFFDGWYDGLHTYGANQTFSMGAREVTLLALWTKAVTVTFHDNSVERDVEYDVIRTRAGSRISAVEPTPRQDHYFGGWFTDPECTVQFVFEYTDINADTHVFAKWSHVYFRFTAYRDGWTVSGPTFDEVRAGDFVRAELLNVPETLRLPDRYEGKPVYGLTVGGGVDGIRYLATDESVLALGMSPLKKVIIPASWTEIGDKAFYCCYSIEEYEFEGNNITRIGSEAFYTNRSLRHINVPTSVTEFGKRAFEFCGQLQELDLSALHVTDIPEAFAAYCYELHDVKFPQGLTVIHAKAFHQVAALTQHNLPATLKRIEADAFGNYSGDESYALTGELWESYESKKREDGTAYEDFTRTHSQLNSIVIPASVEFIGDFAFAWHNKATTLTFEGGCPKLTHIGAYAFAYCKSLEIITLPANLTYLGYEVTRNEQGEVNGFVSNPGDYYNYDQMQLYGGVFEGCEKLKTLALPECVDYLPPRMFRNCKALTEVTFGCENIQFNGSWQAFMNCESLSFFQIPKSVTLIGDETFRGCTGLIQVEFEQGSKCETIYNGVFMGCTSLTDINLPDGLENIGGEAFKGCTSLTSITLPSTLKNIGTTVSYSQYIGEVFADTGITYLYIPANVSTLKPYVFANMHYLQTVEIAAANKMTYFTTFSYNGVNASFTFLNCEKLQKITLNDNFGGFTFEAGVGSMFGVYAFAGCESFTEFAVSDTSTYLTTVDGVLYSGGTAFDGKARTLMTYPVGKADETYTVLDKIGEDAVSEIYHNAFMGNLYLKKVVIAASVKQVLTRAFYEAHSLEEIEFAEGSILNNIGALAFAVISTYPEKNGYPDYDLQPVKTPLKSVTVNVPSVPKLTLNTQGYDPFKYSTENEEFAIYVPAALVDEFKAADGWKQLADFIKPIGAQAD